MQRRDFLAVAGTALAGTAGCAAPSNAGNSTTESTTDRFDDLPRFDPSEVQRRVSLERVDSVPAEYSVSIDLELLNETVTGRDPANVRATVTNTADEERFITRNEGDCALFDRSDGASESPGLHLHRPGLPGFALDCGTASRLRNLWRLDLPEDARCPIESYGCTPRGYDAGESKSETYQIWDDFQEPGYMPAGEYRFQTRVRVGRQRETTTQFEWGFSVSVSRPQ